MKIERQVVFLLNGTGDIWSETSEIKLQSHYVITTEITRRPCELYMVKEKFLELLLFWTCRCSAHPRGLENRHQFSPMINLTRSFLTKSPEAWKACFSLWEESEPRCGHRFLIWIHTCWDMGFSVRSENAPTCTERLPELFLLLYIAHSCTIWCYLNYDL